jgi:pantoate--beta-alanine ligase
VGRGFASRGFASTGVAWQCAQVPAEFPTIAGFRAALDAVRTAGATVGFVPTMGYLHAGHGSLIERAAAECDAVALSIFVNPLQFAADEDLASYPRDLARDLALASDAGATHVLVPSVEEMYPQPVATQVSVAGVSEPMEGVLRPTHFAGVATVVAKLFAITGPCRAYFGEKDFQQLAVVRRMAADLSFPVEVVGCATVREPDGLAMSSRNVYLSATERQAALVLHHALQHGAAAIADGAEQSADVALQMAAVIRSETLAQLDYAEVVDPQTLQPAGTLTPGREVRLLVAARVGTPRLIDNLGVTVPGA